MLNQIRTLALHAIVNVSFAILALSMPCHSEGADQAGDIVGSWLRITDDYRGWIIDITQVKDGEFEGRSLWVPPAAGFNGFQNGEKKLHSIRRKGDSDYSAQSMRRKEDSSSYEPFELSLSNPNTLIMFADNPSGELGDKQRWVRILPGTTEYAYVEYGRGKSAQDREKFSKASKHYDAAVQLILQAKEPLKHQELINAVAWTLAVSRPEIRNPKQALKLEHLLSKSWQYLDTMAAAQAANGDFERALDLENQALTLIEQENASDQYLRLLGLNEKNLGLHFQAVFIVAAAKSDLEDRKRKYEQRKIHEE